MASLFRPRANLVARASIVLGVVALGGVGTFVYAFARSSYMTDVGVEVPQTVPFSHAHHVSGLGIDCRYCHPTVEDQAFAGMPTTQTCMNCHWQLYTNAEMLEPIRQSWKQEAPVSWRRVHDVADFVYFNHSIHVSKGIGCSTCHGRVDQMPLVYKSETLFMEWCIACHREPERFVRPREEVFNMEWRAPKNQRELGRELVEKYDINNAKLTDCSICHR